MTEGAPRRTRTLTVAGLLVGGLAVGVPLSSGGAALQGTSSRPPASRALLLQDGRLDAVVQFTVRTGAVDAWTLGLSDAAEIKLQAAAEIARERISVLNGSAPARRVMRASEWTHAASWMAVGGKEPYRFVVSAKDRERISAARVRHERDGRLAVRRRWDEVKQWAYLDEGGLWRLAKRQAAMAQVLRHKRGNAMARLAFGLPAPFMAKVWQEGVARVPVRSLSPELQKLALTAWRGDAANRDPDTLTQEGWLTVQMGGPPDRQTVYVSVNIQRGGFNGNLLYAEGWVRQDPAERRNAALANPTPVPRVALFRKKVSVSDPSFPKSDYTLERYDNALPLLSLVEQIAEQVEAPFVIATDFRPRPEEVAAKTNNPKKDEAWRRGQWWLSGRILEQPLGRALDLLCADFEYEWSYAGGVIALRHRRWYLPEAERERGKPLLKTMPPFD